MEPLTLGSSVRVDLVFSVPPPSVLPDSKCWIFDRLERPGRKAPCLITALFSATWSSVSGVH